MEFLIKILIYIHAFFGGLGLLSGVASLYFRKGRTKHRNSGQIFSFSMLISSGLSLVIAVLPNHQNTFLFLIGLFTIYLILSGNRALSFRDSNKLSANTTDKVISGSMCIIALIMLIVATFKWVAEHEDAIFFLFFGAIGLFLAISDFRNYKLYRFQKIAWLKSHIGRMVGALIAAFTAFLVTGLQRNDMIFWIAPTFIGIIIITYWTKKVSKKRFYKRSL